jgi:hypothetical protein
LTSCSTFVKVTTDAYAVEGVTPLNRDEALALALLAAAACIEEKEEGRWAALTAVSSICSQK